MRDLTDALRTLRSYPLVSALAILSLALGIGAVIAVFSLTDRLLLAIAAALAGVLAASRVRSLDAAQVLREG